MSGLKRKRQLSEETGGLVKNHISDRDMDKKSEVKMESVYEKTLLKLRNGARNASNNNMGAAGDPAAAIPAAAAVPAPPSVGQQCSSCLNKTGISGRCASCRQWACPTCLRFCSSCSLYENPAAKICGNCSVVDDHRSTVLCLGCRHHHQMQ